jgi:hypothetical protein
MDWLAISTDRPSNTLLPLHDMIAVESIFVDEEQTAEWQIRRGQSHSGVILQYRAFHSELGDNFSNVQSLYICISVYLRKATKMQPGTTVPLYLVLLLP